MKVFEQYRFGFDVWGLLLFLLVMLPNLIWFAVLPPNDVLRTKSVTPMIDVLGSVCQVLLVASLCFVINSGAARLRVSPLIVIAILCVLAYYAGWVLYYCGVIDAFVIVLMTVPPCVAFLLFALDRKNLPAAIFATCFFVCHLVYAVINHLL